MIVPLTLADFLERAELVYGEREAVVDEPSPPGGSLGRFTYGQFAEMARHSDDALLDGDQLTASSWDETDWEW